MIELHHLYVFLMAASAVVALVLGSLAWSAQFIVHSLSRRGEEVNGVIEESPAGSGITYALGKNLCEWVALSARELAQA